MKRAWIPATLLAVIEKDLEYRETSLSKKLLIPIEHLEIVLLKVLDTSL